MVGSRGRVTLLLVLTFAVGAAAGVAADRLRLLPDAARAAEEGGDDRTADGSEGGRETTIERFADELGLTPGQRGHIEEILAGFRSDVKALRKEFHPRWHELVETTREEIETVLSPAQVDQYRALLERERGERKRDDEAGDRKKKGSPTPTSVPAGESGPEPRKEVPAGGERR